jgi:hypothetical protein
MASINGTHWRPEPSEQCSAITRGRSLNSVKAAARRFIGFGSTSASPCSLFQISQQYREMHVLCIGEEFDLPAFSPCSVAQAPCLPTSNHSIWLQRWSQPSRNEATPSRLFAQCREVDRADDEMPGHPHRQMRRLATAEVAHFVDRRSRKLSKIALHITSPGLQQPCCALVNTGWTADVIRRKRGLPGENAVRSALRRVQWQEWNHQMQFLSKAKRAHRQ